jgi:UDP-N-acetylglucosamine kinase
MTNDEVTKAARHWLKQNKKQLLEAFCNDESYPAEAKPVTIFMAGSPGAGKTEFSKSIIETFGSIMVRIDADDIREMMREIGYNGKNAALYQTAVSGAVSNLYSHILKNQQSALIDGTFAYENWQQKVDDSLRTNRLVEIYYLYQDPEVAWNFVKKREEYEGRAVPRRIFIKDYFSSIKNVSEALSKYGDRITVHFAKHNYENAKDYDIVVNIRSIADHLPKAYTRDELQGLIGPDD